MGGWTRAAAIWDACKDQGADVVGMSGRGRQNGKRSSKPSGRPGTVAATGRGQRRSWSQGRRASTGGPEGGINGDGSNGEDGDRRVDGALLENSAGVSAE